MQVEDKFPKWMRMRIYAVSSSWILLLLACVGIIFVYFYLINVIAAYTDCNYGAILGSVVHSVLIIATGTIYRYTYESACAYVR